MTKLAMRQLTRIATFVAVAAWATPGAAQANGFYWSLKYNPSIPVGDVRNFVDNVTPVAFDFDGRYWFRYISVGVAGVHTSFYDTTPRTTYPIENGALTATIYRHIDMLALVPQVHFYAAPDADVVPYAGFGAGISWATFRTVISDIDVAETNSGLILSPEAGVLIPYDRNGIVRQALMLGARYTFTTIGYRDVTNFSYFGLQVGAVIY
jgi:hypothetical protein